MIEVKNLNKLYGKRQALSDVSFSVGKGEILGFLGPNGAGKSTTMNIMTGYISSTGGTVTIDGCDILENPIEAKKRFGYMPEKPPLYPDMLVMEYLSFLFELKKIKLPKDKHISEICEKTKISDSKKRLIKNLSKGYQQRVGLAAALLGDPPVLILDEPTAGLDPKQIIETRNLIISLKKKHTIILSSHILSEVQAVCDRVLVINRGQIVADAKTDELPALLGSSCKLFVEAEGREAAVSSLLKSVEGVTGAERYNESPGDVYSYIVTYTPGGDPRKSIFRAFAKSEYSLLGMSAYELSLEDAFIILTEGKRPKNRGTK